MTLTLAINNLPHQIGRSGPVFIAGLLWFSASEIRLFDRDAEASVSVDDPEAHVALTSGLAPVTEYFDEALLQAWVRAGPDGPELHRLYWVLLGGPPWGGPRIDVRPVPPEYDYVR